MIEPTLTIAAIAGLVSFLSPCMLPVVPAFLAQLAGNSLGASDLRRRHVLSNALLFVAGFSVVFAVLGVALDALLGGVAAEALNWISRVAGAIIILLGLHLTGLLRLPLLDRGARLRVSGAGPGPLSPLLFGACFAVAWTPCVGPVLGSTLALAASQPASAFPLLLAYALGLGAPFLLVGLFPSRALALLKGRSRAAALLHTAFGAVLIFMGVLVFTENLSLLANPWIVNEVLL